MLQSVSWVRSCVAVIGMATLWFGGTNQAVAQSPGTYGVSQLYDFRQIVGSFGATNQQRARGVRFAISSTRKQITIAVPDTWYGTMTGQLTPVSGQRNLYSFSTVRTYYTTGGSSVAVIYGIIQVNQNGVPVAMAIQVRAGNNFAAVVNKQSFGSGVSSVWQTSMTLRRLY